MNENWKVIMMLMNEWMNGRVQVVGWPPIRSFRKNSLQQQKKVEQLQGDGGGMYVKVSMAGAPYLRKIDLKVYNSYPELLAALQSLFTCTFGKNHQQINNNLFSFLLICVSFSSLQLQTCNYHISSFASVIPSLHHE